MHVYSNVLEMIGRTPMLRLTRLDAGPCELYLKLESMNPGGSIKDRIGLSMIEEAEKRGELKPGMTFHFMTGLWLEDMGFETTESILITDTGVECLADVPRKLIVKD